jgi:hypothetical protein
VWLQGQGKLTVIKPRTAFTGVTGSGTPVALIKKFDQYVHLITISDLTLLRPAAVSFTGHGIYLESGSDLTSYPTADPDCYDQIRDLYIYGFIVNTSQCGVWIAGKPDGRGVFIDGLSIRSGGVGGGHGIYIQAVDGTVQNCNIGGTNYPLRIDGGNFRICNIKAWFAEIASFKFEANRMVASCLESQDSPIGCQIDAGIVDIEGLHVDHCSTTGIDIAAGVNTLRLSFLIHQRTNGRYGAAFVLPTGIQFNGGGSRQNINGVIDTARVTTPIAGTTSGASNFMRISHGTTLLSVN